MCKPTPSRMITCPECHADCLLYDGMKVKVPYTCTRTVCYFDIAGVGAEEQKSTPTMDNWTKEERMNVARDIVDEFLRMRNEAR